MTAAHHANSELLILDEKTGQYVENERITEYALDKVGEIVPPDSCRTLPANSMVKWDVHYYPTGEELKDDVIELGLWFYPEGHQAKHKQDLKLYSLLMKGGELEIPPHAQRSSPRHHRLLRQHEVEQAESRSRPVGGARKPYGRRDVACLDRGDAPRR